MSNPSSPTDVEIRIFAEPFLNSSNLFICSLGFKPSLLDLLVCPMNCMARASFKSPIASSNTLIVSLKLAKIIILLSKFLLNLSLTNLLTAPTFE